MNENSKAYLSTKQEFLDEIEKHKIHVIIHSFVVVDDLVLLVKLASQAVISN